MKHNEIKIIDFGENKPIDNLYLNGYKLDYVKEFKIVRRHNELAEITIVLDCKQVEILKQKEGQTTFVNGEKEDVTWQGEALRQCKTQIKDEIKQCGMECIKKIPIEKCEGHGTEFVINVNKFDSDVKVEDLAKAMMKNFNRSSYM